MPRYAITSKAGPFVAGYNNTGAGSILLLSREQAAYEVSLGTLAEMPDEQTAPEPAPAPEPVDLSKMTKAQLLAHAALLGIEVDEKATKAEIIEAIEAGNGGA